MYMVASRDNYGNSASAIYMDALPTVLIESLLGHLHAAALARAVQYVCMYVFDSRNAPRLQRPLTSDRTTATLTRGHSVSHGSP